MDLWHWIVGQVWPNLFASAITTPVALIWHHRKIKKHITETAAQAIPAAPQKEPVS